MSLDLVEIAIDRFTDWVTFEKLASEIMRDEGYPDIKPLGGVHDGGQDASVERFFVSDGKRMRVVFQFSLRSDVAAKIQETIARLQQLGTPFQKLVLATPAQISAETQQGLKRRTFREHEIDLEIFERKTLVNRLADFSNGLFARYFPNIHQQLDTVLKVRPQPELAQQAREREFLKVCCAFTFAPGAQRTRNSLLDQSILAILSINSPDPLTPEGISQAARNCFQAEVFTNTSQVRASLERLVKKGAVDRTPSGFVLTESERLHIEAAHGDNDATEKSVISDIVTEVCLAAREPISDSLRAKLETNARDILVEYFRMNGLELSQCFLDGARPVLIYSQGTPHLVELARRGLPAHFGDLLVAAIGKAISSPTAEQANYFANCSRGYLALQVMNLDPSLRDFQYTRFGTKVFVLETDVVLGAIIEELPSSLTYRNLVSRLAGLGAKILVPEEVVGEVVLHLDISPRTYEFFGAQILALNDELALTHIQNALVRGYWYLTQSTGRASREDFLRYRDNYFDAHDPIPFVAEVIREALPGVYISPISSFLEISSTESELAPVEAAMHELAEKSPLRPYRTAEQTRELAHVDARLMVTIEKYNRGFAQSRNTVLGAKAYIVTSSGRYLRAAVRLNSDARVSARPQILTALLELTGPGQINDREFVALFENPLLQNAVASCWGDVKVLLDGGVELKGKSIVRLRHDVEKQLHEEILNLKQADIRADESEDTDPTAGDIEHVALLDRAEELGYRPITLISRLREEGKLKDDKMAELAAQNEELREAVKRFGRKKERWLRRQAKLLGR